MGDIDAEFERLRARVASIDQKIETADARLDLLAPAEAPPPGEPGARADSSGMEGAASDGFPAQPVGAWIQRCLILTKAGRCVLNCAVTDQQPTSDTRLVVGQLCKLLVTMHAFAGSAFVSYVEIHAHGVVIVDGASFLVALLCQVMPPQSHFIPSHPIPSPLTIPSHLTSSSRPISSHHPITSS